MTRPRNIEDWADAAASSDQYAHHESTGAERPGSGT